MSSAISAVTVGQTAGHSTRGLAAVTTAVAGTPTVTTDSYNPGYYTTDSYNPCYYTTDSYNPGYETTDSYNPGYETTDSYNPGYYTTESYNPGYTTTESYNPGYSETYNESCGCYEQSYSQPYSQPYQQSMSYARSFVPPQFQQYIPQYSQPQYIPQPAPQPRPVPQQQQQQQQQQQGGQPINIVNNNNNTNTNVNTVPVQPATPQPIIQYVQQPIYQPQYQPQYQQLPYCTITASTGANGLVWLTWSSNGTNAYISPNVGNVAPNGSTSLYTYGTSVYTMTVNGPGGSNTCSTQAIAQSVPSVSLSQIPYTGYDFGPIGNALYWAALIAFALAGAYLVVYFQGGAGAMLAPVMGGHGHAKEVHVAAPTHTETVVKAETRDVFGTLPTMTENRTKDSMNIARTEGAVPRIVISRA